MIEINGDMDQIRRRFVRGVLQALPAEQLHAFVTSAQETARDES